MPTWVHCVSHNSNFWQNARNKSCELDFHKFYLHNTQAYTHALAQAFRFNILMYVLRTAHKPDTILSFAIVQKSSLKYVTHFALFVFTIAEILEKYASFFFIPGVSAAKNPHLCSSTNLRI